MPPRSPFPRRASAVNCHYIVIVTMVYCYCYNPYLYMRPIPRASFSPRKQACSPEKDPPLLYVLSYIYSVLWYYNQVWYTYDGSQLLFLCSTSYTSHNSHMGTSRKVSLTLYICVSDTYSSVPKRGSFTSFRGCHCS